VTDAVRTRLEVAHMSGFDKWTSLILIDDDSKTWRNWKVRQPQWLWIRIPMTSIQMRMMGSNGCP